MIKINELTHIYSELFGCAYAVGKTDEGQYTYVWTEQDIDTEIIDENMIENAECYRRHVTRGSRRN